MGSDNSKLSYRNIIIQLTTKTQPVDANDNAFWEQFWNDVSINVQDVFVLTPAAEIRALREESPNNLATLCYKAVERLSQIAEASLPTAKEQQTALNCIRLLTRLLPYIFEDPEWRSFFWSALPSEPESAAGERIPLAQSLLTVLCDLLFCPEFTVHPVNKPGPEGPDEMQTIDSCEYIWQAGVGFAQTPVHTVQHDSNRTEILKLLLTCFSETMYLERDEAQRTHNLWVSYFTSTSNRHALPLFTSLLNIVCAYDPVGFGLPYNHLMFSDLREPLVEVALQVLCIALETDSPGTSPTHTRTSYRTLTSSTVQSQRTSQTEDDDLASAATGTLTLSPSLGIDNVNLFANYMSRIHRDDDFAFMLSGVTRLLNSPLTHTYLPGSTKKVQMHQELLVFFWRMCEINKRFMYYVLKSSQVLELLVPILYHLIEARNDQARLGLVHVGVFILLLLSGERNFGVRLNKPYKNRSSLDIPVFTGTHADLLIVVFHKLITNGHRRLQPLFDCLLTIIVNVSPYLKSLSMVTANKLLHLLEAFSQPWFLLSSKSHYQLVFLMLEAFNNIIQYQFDGNSNLVYTLIRKRQIFYHLANLPTDSEGIQRVLDRYGPPAQLQHSAGSDMDEGMPHPIPSSGMLHQVVGSSSNSVVNHTKESSSTSEQAEENGPVAAAEAHESQTTGVTKSSSIGSGTVLRTTLAETPAVRAMTDHHLANALPNQHLVENSSGSVEPVGDDIMSNMLVSHSSPSRSDRIASPSSESSILSEAIGIDSTTGAPHSSEDQTDKSSSSATIQQHQSDQPLVESDATSDVKTSSTAVVSSCDTNGDVSDVRSPTRLSVSASTTSNISRSVSLNRSVSQTTWIPRPEWVLSWKSKMPFQTVMRLLQVLVPQVEKICIDKGLTDETEIVKFLQNGTLVGLLPVPHPILIRKYQSNTGTAIWFRNYIWGVVYLRNVNPPIWYDTNVRLFEIQRI